MCNIQICCSYKDTPGLPLRYSYDGILKDLLVYCKPKCPKKLFYQILSIKVNELDNKKQFKCLWVRSLSIKFSNDFY